MGSFLGRNVCDGSTLFGILQAAFLLRTTMTFTSRASTESEKSSVGIALSYSRLQKSLFHLVDLCLFKH